MPRQFLNFLHHVTRKELSLFLAFYLFATVVFYTLMWWVYEGDKAGPPYYFDAGQFWAAAGTKFLANFLLTLPIWWLVVVAMREQPLWRVIAVHLIGLPLFVLLSHLIVTQVKGYFGWAFIWTGRNMVWIHYMQALFYVVQFGLIHTYIFQRRYTLELQDKAALREAMLQSEITALKAQVDPHFLHNLFNSINASIPPENERTRELIIQLSDLFRYQNMASQRAYMTVAEEMGFIRNYLDLIKVRFKEGIGIHLFTDETVRGRLMPPMLLQPLVENSISHGIAPKVGYGEISVRAEDVAGKTRFTITDTGIGVADKSRLFGPGLGLANVRLRLQKISNSDLIIEDNQPAGLTITFTL